MRLRIPFTLPSAYISPIPKIVHSAYISKDVKKHSFETLPHSIQRSITSFKEHNPNYESRFIGSIEDMRNDILEFEGGTVLEAFDTLVPFAYKVDLWRLVMMYNIGGNANIYRRKHCIQKSMPY